MTAPANVTTPAQAAQWAWGRSGGIAQNMQAASIKTAHFRARPMSEVRAVACGTPQALAAFRTAWTALQKQHGVQVNAPAAKKAAAAPKSEAQLIYDDMRRQYELWKKRGSKLSDRGAWWGSRAPGVTTGAKAVPASQINAIKALAKAPTWVFDNSRSGELGWHRKTAGKPDFIYHTKAPS